MPYLKTHRGMDWFFDREGEGTAVVFLHGWGVDRRIWHQQIKYFSATHQVIAIDLPGHGATHWQKLSFPEIVDDVVEILDHCGLSSFHLVASSFGGLVALGVTAQKTPRVRSLTLVGSQPKFVRSDDYLFGIEPGRIEKLAGQLRSDYPLMVHIFFRSLFTREERESRRYRWIQTFRRRDDVPSKEAVLGLLDVLMQADLRETLFALSIPILFVNGTEDYICPAAFYHDMKEKLPHAQLAWFPACGHFAFLSQPHEFNKVLADFLAK